MVLSSAVTVTAMSIVSSVNGMSNVVAFCPLMVTVAPALLGIDVTVIVVVACGTVAV